MKESEWNPLPPISDEEDKEEEVKKPEEEIPADAPAIPDEPEAPEEDLEEDPEDPEDPEKDSDEDPEDDSDEEASDEPEEVITVIDPALAEKSPVVFYVKVRNARRTGLDAETQELFDKFDMINKKSNINVGVAPEKLEDLAKLGRIRRVP